MWEEGLTVGVTLPFVASETLGCQLLHPWGYT